MDEEINEGILVEENILQTLSLASILAWFASNTFTISTFPLKEA